jgi:rhamnosyltransferase subunit B
MRVLLVTTGSLGDFLPFVGLARALKARGHEAILLGGGAYERFARAEGIELVALTSAEAQESFYRLKWDGWDAVRNWLDHAIGLIEPAYEALALRCVPGQTVIVALDWVFAARVARDALDCRLVTVHMQPASFRTRHTHQWWSPPWLMAAIHRALDFAGDLAVAKPVNRLRARLGLEPVRRVFDRWWNSPDRVVGFFPEWYARREPDWPAVSLAPGFALYEPGGSAELSAHPDLVRFLDAGSPPILFGQGSWVSDAQHYFRESIEAAGRLGRRALLLTPRRDQLPASMPATCAHFAFVPHRPLLPRCAAFVHHGGTGTLAAGLAAGLPQLAVPRVGDQNDNARRLEGLGVSTTIRAARYRADVVTDKLRWLLEDEGVQRACAAMRERMTGDAFEIVADAVEQLRGTTPRRAAGSS